MAAKVSAEALPNSSVTSQSPSRTWPTVIKTPLKMPVVSLLAPTSRVPSKSSNGWATFKLL